MIVLKNVTKKFHTQPVLKNIQLQIQSGEIFGIMGRSGAGKSTLVRTINLLSRPDYGEVWVDGQNLVVLNQSALRSARRKIGMIFQHFNLLDSQTVFNNIALPLIFAGKSSAEIQAILEPLFELTGLSAYKNRYPQHISGGQKQRVGIARALALHPQVLLCDEATSALDPETALSIFALLQKINRELGMTIVFITHQMEALKQICDRVAVLDKGAIVEQGRTLDLVLKPQHAITRAFMGHLVTRQIPSLLTEKLNQHLCFSGPRQCHAYRFIFYGIKIDQPLIYELALRYSVMVNIVFTQTEIIQNQLCGAMLVLISGSIADIQSALAFTENQGVFVEQLLREE